MIPRHPTVVAHTWRLAAACALAFAACQRRDAIDGRLPIHLGTDDEWSYATHPDLALGGPQLRALTAQVFLATGQFAMTPTSQEHARALLRVMSVDVQPTTESPDIHAQVRVRLEFVPPVASDQEALVAIASGTSRGPKDLATAAACELAISRATQQITAELQAGSKSVDALVADLNAPEASRVSAALERLAAKRHIAAFEPLVRLLRDADSDVALKALSSLVTYSDVRAVRPIIEEAERRDFAFQLEALYALGSIGGAEAEAYLFTIERGHDDPRAQVAAGEALILAQRRSHQAKAESSPNGSSR